MSETASVRCTVSQMNYSACGLAIGDWFEIGPDGVRLPEDGEFCWFAIASVLPIVAGRFGDDLETWLASEPLLACPDPPEGLLMRLERVQEGRSTGRAANALDSTTELDG